MFVFRINNVKHTQQGPLSPQTTLQSTATLSDSSVTTSVENSVLVQESSIHQLALSQTVSYVNKVVMKYLKKLKYSIKYIKR